MPNEAVDQIKVRRRNWTKALRSGEFRQGTGSLANTDYTEFCCLGVAEEVVGPTIENKVIRADSENELSGYKFANDEKEYPDIHYGSLQQEMKDALGLNSNQQTVLISLNENNVPFTHIADVIDDMWIHHDGKIYSKYGALIGSYDTPDEWGD